MKFLHSEIHASGKVQIVTTHDIIPMKSSTVEKNKD